MKRNISGWLLYQQPAPLLSRTSTTASRQAQAQRRHIYGQNFVKYCAASRWKVPRYCDQTLPFCFTLSLSLSLSHTHINAHTRARTNTLFTVAQVNVLFHYFALFSAICFSSFEPSSGRTKYNRKCTWKSCWMPSLECVANACVRHRSELYVQDINFDWNL
jgi:hypothetical protein